MTSSLSHNDSSRGRVEGEVSEAAHRISIFALVFALSMGFLGAGQGWAQTPSTPPGPSQQPSQGQTQETPPATTPAPVTPIGPPITPGQLLQQYPGQSPIGTPTSP